MKPVIGFLLFISFSNQLLKITADDSYSVILDGNEKFSSKLYDTLSTTEGNIFYSPLSVHTILSLVYQGAIGDTAKSLETALRLPNTRTAATEYKNLLEKLKSERNVTMHIANKVYVKENYELKNEFSTIAKNNFLSEAENVDFVNNKAAADKINKWVENKTNREIKDLIEPSDLDAQTRMVLVNAIYFKGLWKHQFVVDQTTTDKFYLSDTQSVKCDMMEIGNRFKYYEDHELDAQIISLPYQNENFALMILLPKSKTGIKDLEKKLRNKNLAYLNSNLSDTDVFVTLPKFKIERKIDLKPLLSQMGMDIIFTNSAEFPNLLNTQELIEINKAVQKAFIEVNEEGTAAAAVTHVDVIQPVSGRFMMSFKADHPFIFVLTYASETILFTGRFSQP